MAGALPAGDEWADEKALFDAARRGSAEALDLIVERIAKHLWSELAGRRKPRGLGPSNGLSDAVQHTLLCAIEKFERFKGVTFADLQKWVGAILRNQLQELTRNYQTRNNDDHKRKLWLALQTRISGERLSGRQDEAAELRQEAARAYTLFESLKQHEQFIIRLRVLEGLSYEEIAFVIEKSSDAARTAYGRAIERLRRAFESDG